VLRLERVALYCPTEIGRPQGTYVVSPRMIQADSLVFHRTAFIGYVAGEPVVQLEIFETPGYRSIQEPNASPPNWKVPARHFLLIPFTPYPPKAKNSAQRPAVSPVAPQLP
jgi:hypothetical protein